MATDEDDQPRLPTADRDDSSTGQGAVVGRTRASAGLGATRKRRGESRRSLGQSMVELALIAPVLIVLFLGTVDFSRLYHAYVGATNAARVGAEKAMDKDSSNSQVIVAVVNEGSPTITLNSVTISPTVRVQGSPVQVGVSYVFSPFTPLVSNFWGGGSLPLVITATARVY